MITIQSLASGSKGNAVFVSSNSTNVLVDVGLTVQKLLKRMQQTNINPETIDAIVITHEHIDHVLGLESFVKRYKPDVYLHSDVVHLFPNIPNEHIVQFNTPSFEVGDIIVNFFPVPHDSQFCFGYGFSCGESKVSIATDLGRVSDAVIQQMKGSQIVMLECNHDLRRLMSNTKYPMMLKRRVSGTHGHLSNNASALAIYNLYQMGVEHVILAHVSQQNNSPTLAYECVKNFLLERGVIEGSDISICVATQDEPSNLFTVGERSVKI